jgi:hypothetical protein
MLLPQLPRPLLPLPPPLRQLPALQLHPVAKFRARLSLPRLARQ